MDLLKYLTGFCNLESEFVPRLNSRDHTWSQLLFSPSQACKWVWCLGDLGSNGKCGQQNPLLICPYLANCLAGNRILELMLGQHKVMGIYLLRYNDRENVIQKARWRWACQQRKCVFWNLWGENAHCNIIVSLEYLVEYTKWSLVLYFKLGQLKINYPSTNY